MHIMKNIFDYNVVMKIPEFLLCFHKCEIEPRPERVKSGVYINDVKGLCLMYRAYIYDCHGFKRMC